MPNTIDISVTDPGRARRDAPVLGCFGTEMAIRGGRGELLGGSARGRREVTTLPLHEAAFAAHYDPEYQEVAGIHEDSPTGTIIAAEGVR